jgi:hypothetical protein
VIIKIEGREDCAALLVCRAIRCITFWLASHSNTKAGIKTDQATASSIFFPETSLLALPQSLPILLQSSYQSCNSSTLVRIVLPGAKRRPSFWVFSRTPPSSWLWLVLPRPLDAAAAVPVTGHLVRRWRAGLQLLIAAFFFIDAVKTNGSFVPCMGEC